MNLSEGYIKRHMDFIDLHRSYRFHGLDIRIHMDLDWICIYKPIENGFWIGSGSLFRSIWPHC